MRTLHILILLLIGFVTTATAQTLEQNAEKVQELRQLALSSRQMAPEQTTSDGERKYRALTLSIGEMHAGVTYFYDKTSGELIRCDITHKYGRGVTYLYLDMGCNGEAARLVFENGEWGSPANLSEVEYAQVMRIFHRLLTEVKNLNRNVAEARFTLLYDWTNVNATLRTMQSMVYVFEDFPEFEDDGGFIVSEDDVSLGNKYRFVVALENYTFYFSATKNPDSSYKDCLFYRINSRDQRRSWLDRECNGSYEYFSEFGDDMFKRPQDDGSFVALMMRDFMRQTLDFMEVYDEMLEILPR